MIAKGCWCNHCRAAKTRRDLDEHFLCATCRAIPGVRGYRDPSKRGLERDGNGRNTVDYWNATLHQLTIVGDDEGEPTAAAPATSQPDQSKQRPKRLKKQVTVWEEYRGAVLERPDLTYADKLVFIELARWADHDDGGNCAPTLADIAKRYGRPIQWAKLHVRRLRVRGVIEVIPLRSRRGWAQNLYRFIGHGFEGPNEHGKLSWLAPSQTPRPQCERDAATGRFAARTCAEASA